MPASVESSTSDELVPHKLKFAFTASTVLSYVVSLGVIAYSLHTLFNVVSSKQLVMDIFLIPLLMFISFGFMFSFFSTLGCFGAYKEKMGLLKMCYIVMFGLITATISISIYTCTTAIMSLHDSTHLKEGILNYHIDAGVASKVNKIQIEMNCCGIRSFKDWEISPVYSCSPDNNNYRRCSVPFSCCIQNETNPRSQECGMKALNDTTFLNRSRDDIIYIDGCQGHVESLKIITTTKFIFVNIFLGLTEFLILKMSSCIRSVYKKRLRARNVVVGSRQVNNFLESWI